MRVESSCSFVRWFRVHTGAYLAMQCTVYMTFRRTSGLRFNRVPYPTKRWLLPHSHTFSVNVLASFTGA